MKIYKKYKIITIVFIITIILLFLLMNLVKRQEGKIVNSLEYKKVNLGDLQIKDRLMVEIDGVFVIGNTKKEIDNGFFDLKIAAIDERTIEVYINKLWKEKFEEKYIEKDYLEELVKNIFFALSIGENLDDQNLVYEYISNIYYLMKSDRKYQKILKLGSLNISANDNEKVLILQITKEK